MAYAGHHISSKEWNQKTLVRLSANNPAIHMVDEYELILNNHYYDIISQESTHDGLVYLCYDDSKESDYQEAIDASEGGKQKSNAWTQVLKPGYVDYCDTIEKSDNIQMIKTLSYQESIDLYTFDFVNAILIPPNC